MTTFSDSHYNRTSFVLAGTHPADVVQVAKELSIAALETLPPLQDHDATHPRIGLVDHVSVAPLCPAREEGEEEEGGATGGSSNMDDASVAALEFAALLAGRVPVMLYGGARGEAGLAPRTLAQTRRETPYFNARAKNSGLSATTLTPPHQPPPGGDADIWRGLAVDLGGPTVDPAIGVCCVGAVPLVLNFNVRLKTRSREVAAAAAAAVRSRRRAWEDPAGGLPCVEALPLRHAGGNFEVACNLLDPVATPPALVLERIKEVARASGVAVEEAYTIGMAVEEIRARLLAF